MTGVGETALVTERRLEHAGATTSGDKNGDGLSLTAGATPRPRSREGKRIERGVTIAAVIEFAARNAQRSIYRHTTPSQRHASVASVRQLRHQSP
jgi:hypothetical protein